MLSDFFLDNELPRLRTIGLPTSVLCPPLSDPCCRSFGKMLKTRYIFGAGTLDQ